MGNAIAATEGATIVDIVEKTQIRRTAVLTHVKKLHTGRLIHISDWRRLTKIYAAVYKIGVGVDKPKPKGSAHSEEEVLRALSEASKGLSTKEIVGTTKLSNSTVTKIVSALMSE